MLATHALVPNDVEPEHGPLVAGKRPLFRRPLSSATDRPIRLRPKRFFARRPTFREGYHLGVDEAFARAEAEKRFGAQRLSARRPLSARLSGL